MNNKLIKTYGSVNNVSVKTKRSDFYPLHNNMNFTWKNSREALYHVITNMIELKSESPIQKTLTHNGCEYIE